MSITRWIPDARQAITQDIFVDADWLEFPSNDGVMVTSGNSKKRRVGCCMDSCHECRVALQQAECLQKHVREMGPVSPVELVFPNEEDLRLSCARREERRLDRRPGEAPSGGEEGMAAAARMASSWALAMHLSPSACAWLMMT